MGVVRCASMTPTRTARGRARRRDRALAVLLGGVARARRGPRGLVARARGVYEVAACRTDMLRFSTTTVATAPPRRGHPRWAYDTEVLSGENPLARQDPTHFGSLEAERSVPHPTRHVNSYPHALDHLAQLFDHGSAPDLVVLHSAAHYWGDQGGHLGEHGSLGIVQARAPFIARGAGVEAPGIVDALVPTGRRRAHRSSSCSGAPSPTGRSGGSPARPSRRRRCSHRVVAGPGRARHVVAMLLDGTNANVLYDLAGRGEAPNIARLMDLGIHLSLRGHGVTARRSPSPTTPPS